MSEINIETGIPFISAGFPSPAEDYREHSISLDRYIIQNPAATFMAYANGNSMERVGIYHRDLLIIDRSLSARDGDVIIALISGEFMVKQISIIDGHLFLMPRNTQHSHVKITSEMEFEVWGVVAFSIRKHR